MLEARDAEEVEADSDEDVDAGAPKGSDALASLVSQLSGVGSARILESAGSGNRAALQAMAAKRPREPRELVQSESIKRDESGIDGPTEGAASALRPLLPPVPLVWESVFGGGKSVQAPETKSLLLSAEGSTVSEDASADAERLSIATVRKLGAAAVSRSPAQRVSLAPELMSVSDAAGADAIGIATGVVIMASNSAGDPLAGMGPALRAARSSGAAAASSGIGCLDSSSVHNLDVISVGARVVDVSEPGEGSVKGRVAAAWAERNPVPPPATLEAAELAARQGRRSNSLPTADALRRERKRWNRERRRLLESVPEAMTVVVGRESRTRSVGYMGPMQQLLWRHLRGYRDVAHLCCGQSSDAACRSVVLLHAVDHVVRARERVRKHNSTLLAREATKRSRRLNRAAAAATGNAAAEGALTLLEQRELELEGEGAERDEDQIPSTNPKRFRVAGQASLAAAEVVAPEDDAEVNEEDEDAFRDQGLSRCRVLILCATRHRALVLVRQLLGLLPGKQVTNLARFLREFSDDEAADGEQGRPNSEHPADWAFRRAHEADVGVMAEALAPVVPPNVPKHAWVSGEAPSAGDDDAGDGSDEEEGDRAAPGPDQDGRVAQSAGAERERDGAPLGGVSDAEIRAALRASGLDPSAVKLDALSKKERRRIARHPIAPADHRLALAGNIDDAFRLGVQVGRKTTRLFSDFFSSDIIVASPLGVKLAIAKAAGSDGEKPGASDFLSSVELSVVDGCTALLQQNWEHVEDIGSALNQRPEVVRPTTNMSRVRFADLDGVTRHLRQTVLLAAQPDADLTAWLRTHCANHRGWVTIQAAFAGAVSRVLPVVRQVFQRVPAPSIGAVATARLAFFMRVLLPRMQAAATGSAPMQTHTLIVASSSLEYVRLRNALDAEDIEFAPISEHSDAKDVSRARDLLITGDAPILLTTERWYFFNRSRLRGTRHVVFYGPPRMASTYVETLNGVDEAMRRGEVVSCLCLFNRLEGVQLERLVGTERCGAMLAAADDGGAASSSAAAAAMHRMRRQTGRDSQAGKRMQQVSTFVFVNE